MLYVVVDKGGSCKVCGVWRVMVLLFVCCWFNFVGIVDLVEFIFSLDGKIVFFIEYKCGKFKLYCVDEV